MGCDIHCYVEYRPKHATDDYAKHWQSFGHRTNPGRNYSIFAALAGVRAGGDSVSHPPVRGIPDDLGFWAADDYWLFITDTEGDGYCTAEHAAKYRANGSRYRARVGDAMVIDSPTVPPMWVEHPDWHTASWVTPDEWRTAIDQDQWGRSIEYVALLAAMRSLEQDGQEVRVVFWFDN